MDNNLCYWCSNDILIPLIYISVKFPFFFFFFLSVVKIEKVTWRTDGLPRTATRTELLRPSCGQLFWTTGQISLSMPMPSVLFQRTTSKGQSLILSDAPTNTPRTVKVGKRYLLIFKGMVNFSN